MMIHEYGRQLFPIPPDALRELLGSLRAIEIDAAIAAYRSEPEGKYSCVDFGTVYYNTGGSLWLECDTHETCRLGILVTFLPIPEQYQAEAMKNNYSLARISEHANSAEKYITFELDRDVLPHVCGVMLANFWLQKEKHNPELALSYVVYIDPQGKVRDERIIVQNHLEEVAYEKLLPPLFPVLYALHMLTAGTAQLKALDLMDFPATWRLIVGRSGLLM